MKMKVRIAGPRAVVRRMPLTPAQLVRVFGVVRDRLQDEREWLETCAILGGDPHELDLKLCDDVEIRDYQRRYRRLDRATDVLSFPSRELLTALQIFGSAAAGGGVPLGDLLISLETVERAALRVRRPVREEFLEVFIHGILHLLGYDHIGDSASARLKARKMRRLQKELFGAARAAIRSGK